MLPNNKNIVAVAKQVDVLSEKQVAVVATHSVPEALAALVEYDPNASVDVNEASMQEALGRVRTGEVTQAVRTASVDGNDVKQGDWIALARDGMVGVGRRRRPTRCASCSTCWSTTTARSSPCSSAPTRRAHDTERIREHIEFAFPHLEVEFHDGGQPLYPYLVGVE